MPGWKRVDGLCAYLLDESSCLTAEVSWLCKRHALASPAVELCPELVAGPAGPKNWKGVAMHWWVSWPQEDVSHGIVWQWRSWAEEHKSVPSISGSNPCRHVLREGGSCHVVTALSWPHPVFMLLCLAVGRRGMQVGIQDLQALSGASPGVPGLSEQ